MNKAWNNKSELRLQFGPQPNLLQHLIDIRVLAEVHDIIQRHQSNQFIPSYKAIQQELSINQRQGCIAFRRII